MQRVVNNLPSVVLVAVVLAFIVFAGIDAMAISLDPEAAELIEQVQAHRDPADNAYYALVGLQLPGRGDIDARGRSWAQGRVHASPHLTSAALPNPGAFPAVAACQPSQMDCLAYYRSHADRIRAAARTLHPLLAGYRHVIGHYREFYQIDGSVAWGLDLINVHSLYLFELVQQWHRGERGRALHGLATETAFWRMILARADTLFAKSLAAAVLGQDYGLAQEFVAACGACGHRRLLKTMLSPLSRRELDLVPALNREFVRTVRSFRKTWARRNQATFPPRRYHYEENRAINALYDMLRDERRIARASPARIQALAERLDAKYAERSGLWWKLERYLHPISHALTAMSWRDPEQYVQTLCQLDAFRARAAAALAARSNPTPH